MLNLNDLYLFVQAVEQGGFAAASRHLGIPKSTLSKRVSELEESLGARLIHRTSRSFVLTDSGRDFLDHAQAALIEAESAETAVRSRLAEPRGRVRMTASVPVAQFYLAERLPELARRHPGLQLQLHVTDRFVDLVQEGFDIALRSHFAPLPDSSLLQRRLSLDPMFLLASPAYLDQHGWPERAEELKDHLGLLASPSAPFWRLHNEQGEEIRVTPRTAMLADESVVLLKAATAGLGITCLPRSVCRDTLEQGELCRILPDWTAGTATTTLLMPHRRGQLPAVRAVVEFLARTLQD